MNDLLHTALVPFLSLLAQEGAAPEGGARPNDSPFGFLFPMIAIVAIFYFVLIAPERKKQKKREAMLAAMGKGDAVMTNSGMYGTVVQIQDDRVTLQVADNVRLRFNRAAIQSILNGDDKADGKGEASKKD